MLADGQQRMVGSLSWERTWRILHGHSLRQGRQPEERDNRRGASGLFPMTGGLGQPLRLCPGVCAGWPVLTTLNDQSQGHLGKAILHPGSPSGLGNCIRV